MLELKPGRSTGVKVRPNDHVLATSGTNWLFPEITWPHCPDTHCVMLFTPVLGFTAYSAGVTPVCSQAVSDAVGTPAHGSAPTTASWPYEGAANSSIRLGARTARSNEIRKRASWMGAY